MLVALAGTSGMFSQDRDMYRDGSQEKILWGGASHFKGKCSAQHSRGRVESRGESVSEALLERGALCDKREYQVQACGRGTGLVWADSRKQCQ